ncbi:hypothetical protein RD792_006951 [Penstemon davidsonii]|uniref:B box-type domain-containing protein n=1 Tax=Penstemon davidsonii TaxID=160366 RepID=A0ABR0D525_9LAMI|nr:hypothetical protein RD792_006951 [Penstemon davidsonii]
MSKKGCELCSNPARMFCESDQASLCWDCDEKVHAANFLVAKHSRTLLCHVCSSPTAWKAAGTGLRPAVTVCQSCAENEENLESRDSQESESDDGEYNSDTDTDTEGGDYSSDDDEEEDEEEDGENQVVPWSTAFNFTAASSSGTAEEEDSSFSSVKRMRGGETFESEDEYGCFSSQNPDIKLLESQENYDYSATRLFRPLKLRRTANHSALISPEPVVVKGRIPSSGTAAIVDKLQRFQQEIVNEGENDSGHLQTH